MKNYLFEYIEKYMKLTDAEKEAIIDLDIFRSFKKGTIILSEGQTANEGYFVLKGCIRVYYLKDGEEKTTEFYTENEGITPQSLIKREPSEYFISCVEDCILSISNPLIEENIFEKFPRFEKLCRIISEEQLVNQQSTFNEFKTSSPEQRYLNLMESRPDLLNRVPLSQLASFLGITPQSLSRMRSRIAGLRKKVRVEPINIQRNENV